MQPLIKITTEPIQITRFTQNARLVTSDSVDIERRKAIARHRTMHKTSISGSSSIENLNKINRTFSHRTDTVSQPQPEQNISFEQLASQQNRMPAVKTMPKVSVPQNPSALSASDLSSPEMASAVNTVAAETASATVSQDVSAASRSSYTMERGAFEMRVAKGELTYLPPLIMTIVTQRPAVHVEYLGGYNYFPRPAADASTNINLFT